jgi:protein-disulfide isomerase/uncharacterized membrane protein
MSSAQFNHSFVDNFTRSASNRVSSKPLMAGGEIALPLSAWRTMFGCSTLALLVSSYLAWSSLTSSPVAGCGGGNTFDCSHVLHTRWSSVLSVPVSIPAIATHFVLLSTLMTNPTTTRARQIRMGIIGFASFVAGTAAVWFIGLQLFVIGHLCPYCLVAHAAGIISAGVFLWNRPANLQLMKWTGAAAIASVSLLAGLQLSSTAPATYETIVYPRATPTNEATSTSAKPDASDGELFAPPTSVQNQASLDHAIDFFNEQTLHIISAAITNPTTLLVAEVQAESATASKTVEILGGVTLATDAWPLVGNPDAELVFVELFDYTCSHCQRTHQSLKAAEQKYGDRLAVISLPVPLDGKCNPTVRSTDATHAEACDIAKLAIAVWTIDRQQFAEFHDYLFASKPTYAQAMVKAQSMVDAHKLKLTLQSTLPADYVKRHIALYQKAGAGQIPKLMFPGITTVGAIESPTTMIQLIEQHLVKSN